MLTECTSDDNCTDMYPNFPICDLDKTKSCVGIPHELHPPDTFDFTDLCKTTYGLIYVYDEEVKACRVPKCSVMKDYCPKPSKCWRGKGAFIYYVRVFWGFLEPPKEDGASTE